MNIENLKIRPEFKGVSDKWLKLIDEQFISTLDNILNTTPNISPKRELIFNFARLCNYEDIKVVILAQDPYPDVSAAMGLAFSAPRNHKTPKSLNKMYDALCHSNLIKSKPNHPDLRSWAQQGILLINTALTTPVGVRGGHINEWKIPMENLLNRLCENKTSDNKKLIFLLWGNPAKKTAQKILNIKNHICLEWGHPSPISSVNNDPKNTKNFLYCDHFIKVNEILKQNKDSSPVNWDPNYLQKTIMFVDGSCIGNGKANAPASYGLFFPSRFMKEQTTIGKLLEQAVEDCFDEEETKYTYLFPENNNEFKNRYDYYFINEAGIQIAKRLQIGDKLLPGVSKLTNNIAELSGVIQGLQFIYRVYQEFGLSNPIAIITDSGEYTLNYIRGKTDINKKRPNYQLLLGLEQIVNNFTTSIFEFDAIIQNPYIQNMDFKKLANYYFIDNGSDTHPGITGGKNSDIHPGIFPVWVEAHQKNKPIMPKEVKDIENVPKEERERLYREYLLQFEFWKGNTVVDKIAQKISKS